ncbi:MAG: hypothetical protein PF795_04180, partial [Kiritimatiellae bacterium]|nr:hypothetical protein [Kiritimatiellia bacterium]
SEERNRMLFVSAYLKCLYRDGIPMPPPLLHEEKPEKFLPWVRKHRLDAVIAHPCTILPLIRDTPFSDPDRFGVAGFSTSLYRLASSSYATYVIDGKRLGALAVEFLQTLLHKNRYGVPVPETQHAILAKGYWRDGDSIRAHDKIER